MSNNFQNQNQNKQAQKDPSANQGKEGPADKVGNNIEKDEPRAEGGIKKEAHGQNKCPSVDNRPSQDNRLHDSRKSANAS